MNVLKYNRVTFFDILKEIDRLLVFYEKKVGVLSAISKKYSSLKFRKENKLVAALLFEDRSYLIEKQKTKLIEEYKNELFYLIKELEKIFLKTEFYFQNLSSERYKINKKTINSRIELIRENFDLILKEFLILEKITLNNQKLKFRKIKKLLLEITSNIEIIENTYNLNTREVETLDYKKTKKLSFKDLKIGDIILFDKGEKNLNFFRRFLKFLLSSTIIHSSIIYNIQKDKIYILEANSFNSRIVSIDQLIYEKDFNYIVMRSKKNLTKKQKQKLIELSDEAIGEKFNNFKLLAGSFERFIEYIFHNLNIKRKSNPLKTIKGTFCSEVVVRIYQKLGIQLGISEDSSMASPVDIFKSKSLNLVGILNK